MKIIFVAPRYHTNQVEIVKSLKANGHCIEFHVVLISKNENHDYLKPKIIKESNNKINLISGSYNAINLMKNDYINLKNFGFEELDIIAYE